MLWFFTYNHYQLTQMLIKFGFFIYTKLFLSRSKQFRNGNHVYHQVPLNFFLCRCNFINRLWYWLTANHDFLIVLDEDTPHTCGDVLSSSTPAVKWQKSCKWFCTIVLCSQNYTIHVVCDFAQHLQLRLTCI